MSRGMQGPEVLPASAYAPGREPLLRDVLGVAVVAGKFLLHGCATGHCLYAPARISSVAVDPTLELRLGIDLEDPGGTPFASLEGVFSDGILRPAGGLRPIRALGLDNPHLVPEAYFLSGPWQEGRRLELATAISR